MIIERDLNEHINIFSLLLLSLEAGQYKKTSKYPNLSQTGKLICMMCPVKNPLVHEKKII